MKKILLLIALSMAFGAHAHGATESHAGASEGAKGAIEYERESTFQIGIDGGYDSFSKKNFAALAFALPLGDSGFKVVAEYAHGRQDDGGANVTILKAVKELYSYRRFEFGAVLGVAHSVESDLIEGTKMGNGWVAGGEVAYDLSKLYSLKVEATRFIGTGVLSEERSNVLQSGLVIKF